VDEPFARWSEDLARRASRRDLGGWVLRTMLAAGLVLTGNAAAAGRKKCRHIEGGCGRCGWYKDGCGGFPRCEKKGYWCEEDGLDCPRECQYATFWSCCCNGVVYRCTDCRCNRKICICRGATESRC
jgi:hypothetical protein